MVEQQIRARGITAPAVLAAMAKVPRHLFVPSGLAGQAYDDQPLPIGFDQTISQPYIVAFMTEAVDLTPGERVLEIGTGSGYQAAVLAELGAAVYSIEIVPELGERARETLRSLGYGSVQVKVGNGYDGWPEHAPFDAIVVTAAPEQVPQALVAQLAENGRMAVPVGSDVQEMAVLTKRAGRVTETRVFPVRFVPMVRPP
jgi:protein-L-isoaspartate(D-aspartate) O-methyltransferase